MRYKGLIVRKMGRHSYINLVLLSMIARIIKVPLLLPCSPLLPLLPSTLSSSCP